MKISEIRARNLRALIRPEVHGNTAEFAREHGLDATYLRQMLGGHRSIGEKSARNLESAIGLRRGSLDQTEATTSGSAFQEIEKALNEADFLNKDQKAHFVGLLRTMSQSKKKSD